MAPLSCFRAVLGACLTALTYAQPPTPVTYYWSVSPWGPCVPDTSGTNWTAPAGCVFSGFVHSRNVSCTLLNLASGATVTVPNMFCNTTVAPQPLTLEPCGGSDNGFCCCCRKNGTFWLNGTNTTCNGTDPTGVITGEVCQNSFRNCSSEMYT